MDVVPLILLLDDTIPNAFKACGLCNDKYGRENHLIQCQKLKTYKAPERDYVRRKKPFSEAEIKKMFDEEMKFLTDKRSKRHLTKQLERYKKNQQKRKS